jgi:hypothetical protein
MEDIMQKIVYLTAFTIILFGNAGAVTGLDIGIKGGIVDNYNQSGLSLSDYDINRMNLIGGQISYSGFPLIDILVAAEYSWRKETYEIDGYGFEFKLRDLAVTASAVYPIRLSFVSPYVGGGFGSHSLSYEYLRPVALSLSDNGVIIPETSTFFGYHGIVGAEIKIPAFPVGFFVEGRINRVNVIGKDVTYNTYTGGVYLSLP